MTGRHQIAAPPRGLSAPARPLLVAALAALSAACGGGPGPIADEPRMQLSATHLTFELSAYAPATVSPASHRIRIANPSSTPLSSFPNQVGLNFLSGGVWLEAEFGIDDPGYHIDLRPIGLQALDAGVHQARVSIEWPGASNSPAIVTVDLVVHPTTDVWRQGEPTRVPYRFSHAAVALPDGGALLLGGKNAPPYTQPESTIERLDPYTGTWSLAGTLERGRYEHTATLLRDGTVLVAGGRSDSGSAPNATWELYHPGWQDVIGSGPLVEGRYNHAAVRLRDGRVLLVGGVEEAAEGQAVATRRCEIFDPATRTSTEVEPILGAGATEGTAVLLPDGRVLITGATAEGSSVGAEIFDPGTGRWTATRPRNQVRALHGLAALPGGRAIVFGGFSPTSMAAVLGAEIYDPVTDLWMDTGSLLAPHVYAGPSVVSLPDGRVLVAGGFSRVGIDAQTLIPTAVVEVFDPRTSTWSIPAALPAPLGFGTVLVLEDGTVMVAGGYPNADSGADFWDPAEGRWTAR